MRYFACLVLFRYCLPLCILIIALIRPSILSGLYCILLFVTPLLQVPTAKTMNGATGTFLKVQLCFAILGALMQGTFHLILSLQAEGYDETLIDCSDDEVLLRNFGFVAIRKDTFLGTVIMRVAPESLMLLISIFFFVIFRRLTSVRDVAVDIEGVEVKKVPEDADLMMNKKYANVFLLIGRHLVLMLLCITSLARPSITAGFYFLMFFGSATWWACCKPLQRTFGKFLLVLATFVLIHIFVLYFYQSEYFHRLVPGESIGARLYGLAVLAEMGCRGANFTGDPRRIVYNAPWPFYIQGIALFLLFHIMVLLGRELLHPDNRMRYGTFTPLNDKLIKKAIVKKRWHIAIQKVREQLLKSKSGSSIVNKTQKRLPSMQKPIFRSTSSERDAVKKIKKPTMIIDNIIYIIVEVVNTLIRVSYLGTNIIMMAWSITFISWASFVLLIWANLIWLVPHQRKAMLCSSPYLLIYIFSLLSMSYVLSLDLNENEFIFQVERDKLFEIGIRRDDFKHMALKCVFTTMFFITLRQYMQEKIVEKQSAALADMVSPLSIIIKSDTETEASKSPGVQLMEKLGELLVDFLRTYWIWVVAGMLFGVAITGHVMTGFRIIYMALFLLFLLTFQMSFKLWRKCMYGFWLVVILFSMIVLVATYTHQFKSIPQYLEKYLLIDKKKQLYIGLRVFHQRQLFVSLLTPTAFLIITVIQLHYFHKYFMERSDPNKPGTKMDEFDDDEDEEAPPPNKTESEKSILLEIMPGKTGGYFLRNVRRFQHKMFLFLEIHMLKLVYFFAMLMCLQDKTAPYLVVVLLLALGFIFGRYMKLFAIYYTSLHVSVLVLMRMLYQLDFFPTGVPVQCTVSEGNITKIKERASLDSWMGFQKTDYIFGHVKWNIIYLFVVTLYTVVLVRQYYYRLSRGKSTERAFFVFPNIKRADAEKNLTNMLKYLMNYGFFKFGLEFSLIALVVYVAIRMDAYALAQACWLLVLFALPRKVLSKIWILYLVFTAMTLPFQYLMIIGSPPTYCTVYPWRESSISMRLQEWAFLVSEDSTLNPNKLLCDFFLLLFISRQWSMFKIERKYAGKNYPGGHNDIIIHLADRLDFENPVPDFVTYVRSYLDVAKRIVLLSWFWITLAIGFLAGANRVNIFSLGYLMGAFYFLWQGTDFYLKPINKILRDWQYFMLYNVIAIFTKAAFQFVGCVVIELIPRRFCWAIYLLGIGCVRKFDIDKFEQLYTQPECKAKDEYLGLFWDAVSFGFLIMQRRLFNSFNFLRIVDDAKAGTILAWRGNELMEEMRIKRMNKQMEAEQNVLRKIKSKVDKVKTMQQKMQALRPGDYYIFEDFVIEDIDNPPKEEEKEYEKHQYDIPTIGEFIHDTLLTDINTVVKKRRWAWKRKAKAKKAKATASVTSTKSEKSVKSVSIEGKKSKASTEEELDEDLDVPVKGFFAKLVNYWYFLWALVESIMLSLTNFYSKYTVDFQHCMKVLTEEKKILKEKTKYNVGTRLGKGQIWQPTYTYKQLMSQAQVSKKSKQAKTPVDEMSEYDQPIFLRLLLAHWYLMLINSEVMCYLVIFLNQARTATFLSIPKPILALFWSTLTVPRPSKTFWVTIIAFIEVTVLIKCLFQLDIIPWNDDVSVSNPFFPPKVIGIDRRDNYAMYDLVLLLVVFFHRTLLKNMGIWTTVNPPKPYIKDGNYYLVDGHLISERGRSIPKKPARGAQKTDNEPLLSVKSIDVEPCNYFAHSIKLSVSKYLEAFQYFTQQLVDPRIRIVADVYSLMLLCDIINFFILLFGFAAFVVRSKNSNVSDTLEILSSAVINNSNELEKLFPPAVIKGANIRDERKYVLSTEKEEDGDVISFVQRNEIPANFLLMLMFQFFLMIIDRGIYLRKNIIGKIVFQIVQVLVLHIWLFVLYPILAEKEFNEEILPQLFYMIKCIYFILSAYQIRCGYPNRTFGHFLCKNFGVFNWVAFKLYFICPLWYELRAVTDWMWTDTAMNIADWIKMDDIFAHVFQVKCERQFEEDFPHKRGKKRNQLIKYALGGSLLLIIVGIIWLPLILYSMKSSVGKSNVPLDVSLELRMGLFSPIYARKAQGRMLKQFTGEDMSRTLHVFNKQKKALNVLTTYTPDDVLTVELNTDSSTLWLITPPDRQKLIDEIKSDEPLNIRLGIQMTKQDGGSELNTLSYFLEAAIPPSTPTNPNENRDNLLKMVESTNPQDDIKSIHVPFIFPKFLKITNLGEINSAGPFLQNISSMSEEETEYRNLSLRLLKTNSAGIEEWWQVTECTEPPDPTDKNYRYFLSHLPYNDCNKLILYTLNEKIFTGVITWVTSGGVLGFYGVYIFFVYEITREMTRKKVYEAWLDEIPNADRIFILCNYVYIAREMRKFEAEEIFFDILTFTMRSNEQLVKLAREEGDPYDPPMLGHGFQPPRRPVAPPPE